MFYNSCKNITDCLPGVPHQQSEPVVLSPVKHGSFKLTCLFWTVNMDQYTEYSNPRNSE